MVCQGSLNILWNLKVQYCIHKRAPPVPVQSQINPIHAFHLHFFNINFHIILPSMVRSSQQLFPSGFPTKTLYAYLSSPHTSHIPSPSHSSFDCLNKFWRGIHSVMKLFIMQSPVTSSLQGPYIFLCTHNICSSLNASMRSSQQ